MISLVGVGGGGGGGGGASFGPNLLIFFEIIKFDWRETNLAVCGFASRGQSRAGRGRHLFHFGDFVLNQFRIQYVDCQT